MLPTYQHRSPQDKGLSESENLNGNVKTSCQDYMKTTNNADFHYSRPLKDYYISEARLKLLR